MKQYLVSLTFLLSIGFIVFQIMGSAPDFPQPRHGYSTEHAHYDSLPPERPHVVSLVCDLAKGGTKPLDFSNKFSFENTDGIAIRGNILHCDVGETLAVSVEFSRKYKQTIQIVGSSSAVFHPRNGQCEIELGIRYPKNVSKYTVTVLGFPIDQSGVPLVDSPYILAEGVINLSGSQ